MVSGGSILKKWKKWLIPALIVTVIAGRPAGLATAAPQGAW
jgi:hypothetical protein